ncbi:hypothetical protein [Halolamina sp.]|jgi:hypothetical protein|uniref:DUF7108 family protein n=1 Tax=Halolamina sp. TaxID=1940283 RepID=UPI000223B96A|nr:hypothetical protein Halar_0880 [halophilic archaeon DL31]
MTREDITERAEEIRKQIVADQAAADDSEERIPDIPEDAVDEAERLTRLARAAEEHEGETDAGFGDDALAEAEAYREQREALVADHDYQSRIRAEDDTLVLYPEEWLEDGVVQFDRIEETERAVELQLSGAGDPERWQEIADYNVSLADTVAEEYGDAHGANASAFATFVSNHYAKNVERVTPDEVQVFLTEYYPRNAWPSEAQASLVEESIQKMFAVAEDNS